uniref:microcin C ABC transporter permease YejB n=1 Tax=Salmonella enterica TaxID=28901 RepID=UPI000464A866
MGAYLIRRLLLVIPTLWAIITINFFIVQIAPGGPVDQAIAAIEFGQGGALPGASGEGVRASHAQTGVGNISDSHYRGGRGLDPEVIAEITHRYGFDKPLHERYFKMLRDYLSFDFGDSLFRSASVLTLIKDSLPVSITLGLWSTLIIYLVSIPLGIRKAVHNGSRFDVWSSAFIIIGYAIPAFLFAILLIVFFAGGSYYDIFPLRGLVSANFDTLPWYQKITDYLWHITLPVLATVIGGFSALTMLTEKLFFDEGGKKYVVTARAKRGGEKKNFWKKVFFKAMLLGVAGVSPPFFSMFFSRSLVILGNFFLQ